MNPSVKFSKDQEAAFCVFDKELCVSAGAGSGKTSVLVERFLRAVTQKNISPGRILAITFTEKATNQMRSRLVEACRERGLHEFRREIEDAYISTIHGFCARLLKENPIESGLDPFFRVLGEGETDILAAETLDVLFEEEASNPAWMAILSQIGEDAARDSIRKLYDLYRATGGDESIFNVSGVEEEKERKKEFVRVVKRYQDTFDERKKRLSAYDFDDLLFLASRLLSGTTIAQKAVRARYRKHFELVLVDEYQDVSPLQDGLIELLKNERNLFIVGDIQQSIYSFRHAEPDVFRRRIESAKSAGSAAKNLVLKENYRSRAEILGFVNSFFTGIFPASDFFALDPKKAYKLSASPAVELLCLPRDKKEEGVDVNQMRVREARRLAAWIGETVSSGAMIEENGRTRPVGYGDFAMLFRAATSSRLYEKELSERGIPFEVMRSKGFYDKPEIADLLGFLKLLENPEDDIALAGVLRSPLVGTSDDTLYWLAKHAKKSSRDEPLARGLDGFDLIGEIPPEEKRRISHFKDLMKKLRKEKDRLRLAGVLGLALEKSDYEAKLLLWPDGPKRVANVRKLLEMADGFEANGVIGVGDFVRTLERLSEREALEPEAKLESGVRSAVTLSTIHAAKGLEFPVVLIADMGSRAQVRTRGPFTALPGLGLGQKIKDYETGRSSEDDTYKLISEKLSGREEAEEWRLLYVAMTRAKEKLVLSGSLSLGAKDGDFKKDGTWMNCLCSTIGFHPLRQAGRLPAGRQGVIDFHGVKVGILDPSVKEARPTASKGDARPDLPEDFAEALKKRLGTEFMSYEETEDFTVTDLLVRTQGEQAPEAALEEDFREESRDDEEPVTPANEYGTIFHRLLERLVLKKTAKLSRAGLFSRLAAPLTKAEKEIFWKQAVKFWTGPWGQAIRKAERLYPELPFIFKTSKGLLKGQIDLVFKSAEGDWIILDYKTGALSGAADRKLKTEAYRFQIELYALVFKRLYGEAPKKGSLYFSSTGETSDFIFKSSDFDRLEQKLAKALDF